jgi:hypothetical protein
MASMTTRKEPVLEEQMDVDDDAPLLLTNLVRPGLPPQLWRHADDEAPEAVNRLPAEAAPDQLPPHGSGPVATPGNPSAFSMRWEEAAEARNSAAAASGEYAQAAPHWQDDAASPETLLETTTTDAPEIVGSTAAMPPMTLDFLKDFEELLFREIERRIINEIEEQVTQHLQTVWKERISLTIMRTLALEGVQLRESLSEDLRKSLPEILQRVLHEGLDQINASEIE